MFSVPQFIDVEDKIAGPLTWKQLGWMIAMGAVLLVMFLMFKQGFALVAAVPVVLLFVALAFYKPNGFPLTTFIFHGTMFFFRPKIAVWERPVHHVVPEKKEPEKPEINEAEHERPSTDKIKELAKLIDREKN